MADTDPAATLRRAAELAPKVLPARIGKMISSSIGRFLPDDIKYAGDAIFEMAAEVLALAEQQQTRSPATAIALMRPDRKVVAVLDNPQFEESYQLVGIGEPVDGHRWSRPSELASWIPLVPEQNGEQ